MSKHTTQQIAAYSTWAKTSLPISPAAQRMEQSVQNAAKNAAP